MALEIAGAVHGIPDTAHLIIVTAMEIITATECLTAAMDQIIMAAR